MTGLFFSFESFLSQRAGHVFFHVYLSREALVTEFTLKDGIPILVFVTADFASMFTEVGQTAKSVATCIALERA